MSEPVLAVVGHANPGKSSIVSTLACDDSVRIGPLPGTTLKCRSFPMTVDERTLYTLIDTPGFERPRQMLTWLRAHETTTGERRETIQQFVRTNEQSEKFHAECELLRPVLDGAAILYVVDGSKPPSSMNEAEMEILRWTGQPRMALINRIDDDDFSQQWRSVLDQYFNLVRMFDAHHADFHQRLDLLRGLRELSDDWRGNMNEAMRWLREDRRYRTREAAAAIADMLVEMVSHTEKKYRPDDARMATLKNDLEKKYYHWLRQRESEGLNALKLVYQHNRLKVEMPSLQAVEDDLLANDTMNRLGLSKTELVAASAMGGAAVGGTIDAGVGGASFFLGTLLGGAAGAAMGYYGVKKLPKVVIGGNALRIGPMSNANFPWVVLDRALLALQALADRAHANRANLDLSDSRSQAGVVSDLSSDLRKEIESLFSKLRKQAVKPRVNHEALDQLRRELTNAIERAVQELDESPDAEGN
jgi:GTPase Era involved in 16S rRNA processing